MNGVVLLTVAAVMYKVFKGSFDEIWEQLRAMTVKTIFYLVLCSVFFNVIEGASYYLMAKKYNQNFKYIQGLGCSYYCAFFKLATLGSGTAVSGMYYLSGYQIPPSASFGMITINYICQKIAVVLLCIIGFLSFYPDMKHYYSDYFKYLLPGILITVIVVIVLLAVCLYKRFHDFLLFLSGKIVKNEKIRAKLEIFRQKLIMVRIESRNMLKDKKELGKLILLNMIKFIGWYMIPCVILGYSDLSKILFSVSISALAMALIGVIPAPGAAGSTEAVFYALFCFITLDSKAAAIMILYRMFTYFLPFFVGTGVIMVKRGKKAVQPPVTF
ncbi:MAG: flippase-like domain-containing protein [Lachnospiraceae bacterium]|nr:flippase-like domain-containing protein [Lachnospiraceae bacterium]